METKPGIYLLENVVYKSNIFKIGSSIDVGRRIKSSDYRTILLPKDVPIYLGSIHPTGYKTKKEIQYLEKIVHHFAKAARLDPKRELFSNVKLQDIINIMNYLGIDHEVMLVPPKPRLTEKQLHDEELSQSIYNISELANNVKKSNCQIVIPYIKINMDNIKIENACCPKIEPCDFQIGIIKAVVDHYKDGNEKGLMLLPCGYGKSYISLFAIKQMKLERMINNCVIFVPTLMLCEQFYELSLEFNLCCDIFKFYGKTNTYQLKEDIIRSNSFLIISTYDSADNLYQLFKDNNIVSDFNIYDEAHNTCVVSKSLSEESQQRDTIFLLSKFKLFMTATQKVVKTKTGENSDENSDETEEVISMNKEEHYGKIITNINFAEAIEKNIISDYRFVVVNSGDPVDVITKAISELDLNHILTYHSTVASANQLSTDLNLKGIKAFTIDGTMGSTERKSIIKSFQDNKNSVLCSCKVLSEGISLNYVDSVYFVDPKSSQIDIIQSMSRCLRLHPDKNMATIIIENNIEKYADILRNIMLVDPRLKLNYKNMILSLGFAVEDIEKNKLEVKYIIVKRSVAPWLERYKLCEEYENIFNKVIITLCEFKSFKIGEWIKIQKKNYRGVGNRLLTEEEIQHLSKLKSFSGWLEKEKSGENNHLPDKESWQLTYELCLEYEKDNNLIRYDTKYKEKLLGRWIQYQQSNYKGTGRRALTETEKEKLNELKTWKQWLIKKKGLKLSDKWGHHFNLCLKYESSISSVIQKEATFEDVNLGSWLHAQRGNYRGSGQRNLTDEELCKLSQLNTWREWLKTQ